MHTTFCDHKHKMLQALEIGRLACMFVPTYLRYILVSRSTKCSRILKFGGLALKWILKFGGLAFSADSSLCAHRFL